jgi:hypothetical protein
MNLAYNKWELNPKTESERKILNYALSSVHGPYGKYYKFENINLKNAVNLP